MREKEIGGRSQQKGREREIKWEKKERMKEY